MSVDPNVRHVQAAPLRRLLRDRGFSQDAMATLLGTDPGTVKRQVGGHRLLTVYWIVRWARVLELTDAEFRNLVENVAVYEHLRSNGHRTDRCHPMESP